MPLRDHFHPPISLRKSWEGVHNGWAFVIAQRLNGGVLPDHFESESGIHHGAQVEIDVATYEEDRDPRPEFGSNGHGNGGVATEVEVYAPPAPPLACEVVMADADTFEINVYKQTGGLKLVAAIELVSLRNKDRSTARRAFATKVASYCNRESALSQ
jgi:hypothetical protein